MSRFRDANSEASQKGPSGASRSASSHLYAAVLLSKGGTSIHSQLLIDACTKRRCRASLFASELPARRIQPLSHFCHTRISKLYCDDTSISPPNRRLTAHMPVCGCIPLSTQADFLCDITRHEPAGRAIMSIRKREWTTSKGEVREAWIVDYADQEGDRHIRTFEKKKDADAYHNTVKVDVRQGV